MMKFRSPKHRIKHNKGCRNKTNQPYNTLQEWMRDPNGVLAILTLALTLIAIGALCISHRALKISEDTEKRQLRAYIGPIPKEYGINNGTFSINILLENFGITPAKNSKYNGEVTILPYPLPDKTIFNITVDKNMSGRIYPKAINPTIFGMNKTFNKSEIAEIMSKNPTRTIYFYGIIVYDDIFSETHRTRYCFYINPKTFVYDTIKGKTGTVKNFTVTECDQHNDFD